MKRNFVLAFAFVAATLAFVGAGRRSGGGGSASVGRAASGRASGGTLYRQHRVSVPRAAMPQTQHAVSDRSRAVYPQKDGSGARISKSAASAPPAHHAEVMKNGGFAKSRPQLERSETVRNHYYWHNENGMRYSHYYDGHNHWYGFYHGPTFYWTRFYGNRWWWSDPASGRWVFWASGFWWWAGPSGIPYVYIDNGYYPYDEAGVTVEQEEAQSPPAKIPPANGGGSTTNSPDGRRMVQVMGADGQAFLYDKTAAPPSFLNYLGKNVSKARFSGGTADAPLQLLVEYKDDTFALFDADGRSQSAALKNTESASTPPAAAAAPPMPSSAPGQ